MFSFTASGRLGRIDRPRNDDTIVRLSIASERLITGPSGTWSKTEWLGLISFDRALNEQLAAKLAIGDSVEFSGRIEPRKRAIGETSVTDHTFIVERFQIARPKARIQEAAA
jgi:hypothetical protein